MTTMVTFIHAADLHLDSPLRGLERYEGAPVDRLRGASRQAASDSATLAYLLKKDIPLVSSG